MAELSPSLTGVALVPVKSREAALAVSDWWSTARSGSAVGAATLLRRSMREQDWSKAYASRVLKAYRQFLELKKVLEDWDAKILAPSWAVEQMWKVHMMDPINYCHDCVLLCGQLVGNDPDGKLDERATEKRILATRQLLRARYESEVDQDIWNFSVKEKRQEPECEDRMGDSYDVPEERTPPVVEVSGSATAMDDHTRLDDVSADAVGSKYSDYDISFRSGLSNLSARRSLGKPKDIAGAKHFDEPEMIKTTPEKSKLVDFQVRIRTLKGQVYHLTVNQETTIYKIKSMIEDEHGTPKEQQHLLYYGKVLEDWKTLAAHSIPPNAGLQLLARSKRTVDTAPESQAASISTT